MAYYLLGKCAVNQYKKTKSIEEVLSGKCQLEIVELYDDEEMVEEHFVEITKEEVDWVIKIQNMFKDE